MKKIYIIIIVIIGIGLALVASLFFLSPLHGRDRGESVQGAQMLREARQLYAEARYEAARDTVLSLRQRYPMALEARRQAILLMDSIELQLAQGDTLKQEFFRRKLAHDREQTTKNNNERD